MVKKMQDICKSFDLGAKKALGKNSASLGLQQKTDQNKKLGRATDIDQRDYLGPDGLLYCYKCQRPKQTYLEAKVNEKKLKFIGPTLCLCHLGIDQEQFEAKLLKQKELDREKNQLFRFKKLGNKKYLNYTFENDDQGDFKTRKFCLDYLKKWQKMFNLNAGILFYGGVGTGKTFFACAMANALLDMNINAKVSNFAEIINLLGDTWDKESLLGEIKSYDFLVIDDFGMERETSYAVEQIYNVINNRLLSNKPTVFTTNLALNAFENPQNLKQTRIFERILEMCPLHWPVEARSKRKEVAATKELIAKNILGL